MNEKNFTTEKLLNAKLSLPRAKSLSKIMLCLLACFSYQVQAQEESTRGRTSLEEVIVTAQRSEESLQDVPIAVTALTGEMLNERQVINPSDLQLNTPNVSFTATNFGNSSFSIRGVGRLVIGTSGESGVSTHINEIPITSNQNAIEFFDVERVEILRGPQGTLFGRNATGGSINMVTKMPDFEGINGFVDGEFGDFDHKRFKGAVNIPFSDRVAIRIAGMALERDGYIKNVASGQIGKDANGDNLTGAGSTLPGIDDDVDGRDLWTVRATLLWEISDNASLWLQYNKFQEEDDRVRITNQICQRTELPTTGCDADAVGFDSPHLGTNTGNLFAMFNGALPLGAAGGETLLAADNPTSAVDLVYNYERPALGFREMHTDFEPIFEQQEDNFLLGLDFSVGSYDFGVLAGYQTTEYFSRQDYNMDVGPTLQATPLNTNGMWPTAQIPAGVHGDLSGPCALETFNADGSITNNGNAGAGPGVAACIHPSDQTRTFSYDQSDSETEYMTLEGTVHSNYEGRFNFTAGISTYASETMSDYYVVGNTLDLAYSPGLPGILPTGNASLYPGYFNSRTDLLKQDGFAFFGEIYVDLTDTVKLTAGIRFNEDNKDILDSGVLANSIRLSAAGFTRAVLAADLGGLAPLGAAAGAAAADVAAVPAFVIAALGTYNALLSGDSTNDELLRLYATDAQIVTLDALLVATSALEGVTAADITAENIGGLAAAAGALVGAGGANLALFGALAGQVPIVPRPGEQRTINGNPSEFNWEETTGRLGVDWNITDDSLLYAFLSRGYKPGGFNPNVPTELRTAGARDSFDAEIVNAIEFGSKNTWLDGALTFNASVFAYGYKSLQVTRIANNSSINDNIDANISGLELEAVWLATPGLTLDANYSYLNSAIDGGASVDPINRTAGEAGWVVLQNIDGGGATGVNFIAKEAELTQAVIDVFAATPATAAFAQAHLRYAANAAGVAIPVYFSQDFADTAGVTTSDGRLTDLDGNQLPNSPEHTAHIGATYTWNIDAIGGDLSLRYDWYWQGESYARDFNTGGDEIDAWDQHNLSLIYNSSNGRLQARLWARNLADDDNITGKYLTSDTSGFYRNYFLTEPRVFGASIRYNFGI